MELTVAVTGASGAIYAQRTLVHLAASGTVERINLIVSESARTVAMVELGFDLRAADEKKINEWVGLPSDAKVVRLHRLDNMAARSLLQPLNPAQRYPRASLPTHRPSAFR